jgi:hypothetical protein
MLKSLSILSRVETSSKFITNTADPVADAEVTILGRPQDFHYTPWKRFVDKTSAAPTKSWLPSSTPTASMIESRNGPPCTANVTDLHGRTVSLKSCGICGAKVGGQTP